MFEHFLTTRSYAALRAADLDWIIGPGYSSVTTDLWDGGGGGAGISKNVTDTRGVTTDLWDGGGGGAGITEKRHVGGVTTDLLDV